MPFPTALTPYNALGSQEVELQPLGEGEDLESAPGSSSQRRKHWWLPPWEDITESLVNPRAQKWIWLSAAAVVVLVAGAILANAKHQQSQLSSTAKFRSSSSASKQGSSSSSPSPFPAEPWVLPSGRCSLADSAAAADVLGPQQQLAAPLNYHVVLHFKEAHFAVDDAAAAAVAQGFQAEANVTFAIQQETSCLQLAASNLTFSSIHASLLTGAGLLQQTEPSFMCLCGSAADCLVDNCARLFKASTASPHGSSQWLLSLGPLVAPAGSTLLLATQHTAHFSTIAQGVTRSTPFATGPPQSNAPAAAPQVIISSRMEPYGAERVFPCMPEPHYKATFAVEIEAPARLSILSNMMEASRQPSSSDTSTVVVQFLPSTPMSLYLVALAVGDMQAVSAHTSSGQLVRAWAPKVPSWQPALNQSLLLAVAALEYYTHYTHVQQPLSKFDMVAVPGRTGAIESWGLLLFDPERFLLTLPNAWSLFRCADVICHEVAHQWFGNLVTAHTWADLLVNEGLASLAEYGCLAHALKQQAGIGGAAALMRQVVPPHGRAAGVHEGPFAKTLEYDALPAAQALLGSLTPDFGVPVYSKAASLMAMLAQHAASARLGLTDQAALGDVPVNSLVATDPPGELQADLTHYLQSRMYGTATAQDVLGLFLSLTPDDMADSSAAVMSGWQQPGSPTIIVQVTAEGLQVSQRRFCSSGLLSDTYVDQLLNKPYGTNSSSIPTPAPLDVHSPATDSTDSSTTGSLDHLALGLSCPVIFEQMDRAVSWTPVLLSRLPSSSHVSNASTADGSTQLGIANFTAASQASEPGVDESSGSVTSVCGRWQIINRDSQLLQLPACIPDATTGSFGTGSMELQQLVLEGDGGWGLYTTLYTADQRAAHRNWVGQQLLLLMQQQQQHDNAMAAGDQQAGSLHLLFMAAKLLKDQATLGLSAFGEVPGWEVLHALQAASTGAAAAAAASINENTSSWVGLGVVTYVLLSPLLPLSEVLLDRVSVQPPCRAKIEAQLASMLSPIAHAALQHYGSPSSSGTAGVSDTLFQMQYSSTDQFLGAMSLSSLLTAAGWADPATAQALCKQFNAAAAAVAETADGVVGLQVVKQLHPDVRDAVLAVSAAQPVGCQLDMSGHKVIQLLHQLYSSAPDTASCETAAFALAHSTSTATQDRDWQEVLGLLLGLSSESSQGQAVGTTQPLAPQMLACGVSVATHAVEIGKVVSRSVTRARLQQAASANDRDAEAAVSRQIGPVLQYLLQEWESLSGTLGRQPAWQLLLEVAVQEVHTMEQWQQLALAVLEHPTLFGFEQQLNGMLITGGPEQQHKQLKSLLSLVWSNVAWGAHHLSDLCKSL